MCFFPHNKLLNQIFFLASSRKLLSDAFLNGLVDSGIWLHKLVISSKDMTGLPQGWWKTCENAKKFLQHLTCFTLFVSRPPIWTFFGRKNLVLLFILILSRIPFYSTWSSIGTVMQIKYCFDCNIYCHQYGLQ